MFRRYHPQLDAYQRSLRIIGFLPHHWRLGRSLVGVLEVSLVAPSDLLAGCRWAQLHVVLSSCRLGNSASRHHFRSCFQWRLVPVRFHLSHQPQEQSRRSLDPTLDFRRVDHHHPNGDFWILHQGLPCFTCRQQFIYRELEYALLHQQHSNHDPETSLPTCAARHPTTMERNRHCSYHRYGRCLLFDCFRFPG